LYELESPMFRIATVPCFAGRQTARLNPQPRALNAGTALVAAARPATADIRIRRLAEESVSNDTYSAILPGAGTAPIDLLRLITEACKDLPEFQIQGEDDERFVLTLTLKS
jgi:hypothetical protein